MIKIYVVTNDLEKWFEKFKDSLVLDLTRGASRVTKREIFLIDVNRLFSVTIRNSWTENERGKVADVIILDKFMDQEKEWLMRASLLGHRNSIIKTEGYWEELGEI